MNRTLQSMLAKCIKGEQSNWSQQLLYVKMAYRTSVHESTGYMPHFLVYGQEVCLPIDFMYPNPIDQPSADIHKFVSARKSSFKRHTICPKSPSISIKSAATQCIIEKSMDPPAKLIKKSKLHNPIVPVGKSHHFLSPWKGPCVIRQRLIDVTYLIQEIATQKT